jgi:hypothetical protein
MRMGFLSASLASIGVSVVAQCTAVYSMYLRLLELANDIYWNWLVFLYKFVVSFATLVSDLVAPTIAIHPFCKQWQWLYATLQLTTNLLGVIYQSRVLALWLIL